MKNKKILITGASGEIGGAVCEILKKENNILGIHGYQRHPKVTNSKSKVYEYQSDLATKEDCYDLVDRFVESADGINGLIQSHGNINRSCHWEDLLIEDWNADLHVNMISSFFIAQRSIYHMRSHGGSIVMMSTASAAHGGGTDSLAYGVAKAGIECITKRLAKDTGKLGIRVNAVAPGFIDTDFHTKRMRRSSEQMLNRHKTIPLNRAGSAVEVAKTIIFLLTNEDNFINGQIIDVDGGDFV